MDPTTAFIAAALTMLAISAAVTAVVWWPLRDLLTDLCGHRNRARFWCAYTAIVVILLPLLAVMLGRPYEQQNASGLFLLADLLKWGLLGLLAALTVAAATIQSNLPRRIPCVYPPENPTDLGRLVNRVEEMRHTG